MSVVKTKTRNYLDSVKTVSLATCMDNKPSCRIMEIQKVEDDLKILFVTHKSSQKIAQIKKSSNVCIISFKMKQLEISDFLEGLKSLSIWKQRNIYGKRNLNHISRVV